MMRSQPAALSDDAPMIQLRNLGPQSARWLTDVGIRTIGELRVVGAVTAYSIVCDTHAQDRTKSRRPSLNLLWALAAGLENLDWRELSDEQKHALLAELEA